MREPKDQIEFWVGGSGFRVQVFKAGRKGFGGV